MARVLILDDEEDSAFIIREMLAPHHEVFVAHDAPTASKILLTRDIQVLITDLMMPQVDGFAFIEMARSRFPSLPTIVISAYYDDSDAVAHQMARRHADLILAKPFSPHVIQGAINDLLRA